MTTQPRIYSLEYLYEQRFTPLSTLDVNAVLASVQAYAQFLARDMDEQLNLFTAETTKSRAIWGGTPQLAFDEVGEFGKGAPRKDVAGQEVHFPLFKLDATVAASEEYWDRASVNDLREMMIAMDNGYAQRVRQEIAAAIFNNKVHTPTKDWLVDNSTLNKIQPFLNGDSAPIPMAPNGTSFSAGSQNHYIGVTGATVATADVDYLIGHVSEHVLGKVVLFTDPAMPATLDALASSKYVARPPAPIIDQTAAQVARLSFNPDADRNNMSVGYWDAYEVVTRSWVPTGYIVAMAIGGQLGAGLHRRVDMVKPGLRTGLEISDGRIRVKESYFFLGFGCYNRAAGAVLDTTHQGSYTVPSGLVRS
jgi:hypothetical protein